MNGVNFLSTWENWKKIVLNLPWSFHQSLFAFTEGWTSEHLSLKNGSQSFNPQKLHYNISQLPKFKKKIQRFFSKTCNFRSIARISIKILEIFFPFSAIKSSLVKSIHLIKRGKIRALTYLSSGRFEHRKERTNIWHDFSFLVKIFLCVCFWGVKRWVVWFDMKNVVWLQEGWKEQKKERTLETFYLLAFAMDSSEDFFVHYYSEKQDLSWWWSDEERWTSEFYPRKVAHWRIMILWW